MIKIRIRPFRQPGALALTRMAQACAFVHGYDYVAPQDILDVFKDEPLTAGSPLAADLPGLHRLPHASAFAPDYLELFFRELAAAGHLA